MQKFTLNAYGKINLTLDVLAKRADGYHQVETVMQSVALADSISFESSSGLELVCNHPKLPVNEENLVFRVAKYLKESFAVNTGAKICLQKNIPLAAGLAGGSSNAASTLHGLNLLWDLRLTTAELISIGQKFGSDIPFCIVGGTALAEGRGEQLTILPKLPRLWLVLVKPDLEVSTKEIYTQWQVLGQKQENKSQAMIQAIEEGNFVSIIAYLSNHLEYITNRLYPQIQDIKQKLVGLGAVKAIMSGSGPTVYGVMAGEKEALRVQEKLMKYYQQVYVTYTL